jgi:hypothetical protein
MDAVISRLEDMEVTPVTTPVAVGISRLEDMEATLVTTPVAVVSSRLGGTEIATMVPEAVLMPGGSSQMVGPSLTFSSETL